MAARKRNDAKAAVLRRQGVLNPHPENVTDPLFRANGFFDPRDLVQLRYEMLRTVREDGRPVSEAAAKFGCTRPTYYKARDDFDKEGLLGLVPRKRGPHGGHKLTAKVLDFIEQQLAADNSLAGTELAKRVRKRHGVEVHASSIRRAVSRREKKGG
jgi:transposase